jgi:hypothetical protein
MTTICAHCKDSSKPVTPQNGKTIFNKIDGVRREIAFLHTSCMEAWATAHGGTTVAELEPAPWPSGGLSQMS